MFPEIVDRFGEAVVGTDGELDRKNLAKLCFPMKENGRS